VETLPELDPRTGKRRQRFTRRARRQRNAARRVRSRLRRGRVRRPRTATTACKVVKPYGRDNVTGWFIYRCGKGILLVPAPRCLSDGCSGSDGRGMRAVGFAGDLGAGVGASFASARSAAGLRKMTGAEVGAAAALIGDLKDQGKIGADYANAAQNAIERRPEQYIPIIAPGVTGAVLGQPIGQHALKDVYALATPQAVGPSVREGCACTPREPDGQDPVSGWLIYRVAGGVLLTPTKKCIAGGGALPGWLAMTWRNVLTLFGAAPTAEQAPPPPPPPGAVVDLSSGAAPPEAACVPDIVVGRDEGMFASGWWIVLRDGNRILVANPKTCP
jgi:hypothetical protein